jgi:glycosyl hydrolase family 39 (putative alpha-L-iduronidase)
MSKSKTKLILLLALLIILAAIPLAIDIINQTKRIRSRAEITSGNFITIDSSSSAGTVNPLIWGIEAPSKEIWNGSNPMVIQRIRDAKIKLIRIGAIQSSNYHLGRRTCTSPTSCDFSDMDRILHAIFDADAEPLFTIAGYPGGFPQHDWPSYATFMKQVVKRYNVDFVLGKKVRYWEMWNEPQIEGDGTIPTVQEYADFVRIVGGAIKAIDPSNKIIAPAAPFTDLGSGGWLSYVAKNTNDLIDVLSWHSYGSHIDTDQIRLEKEKRMYNDDVLKVEKGINFISPTGKRYGAAITEYNMAGQSLADKSIVNFHNNYNAVFVANAIIHAMKAKADLCTFFLLAQFDPNLLGVLDYNNDWTPYKPYYTFYIFGNHFGTTLINGSGGTNTLEYIASKSQDGSTIWVIVVNSNTTSASHVTLQIKDTFFGNYTTYLLDSNNNPTTGTPSVYTKGQIIYTLPALSIAAFDITLRAR